MYALLLALVVSQAQPTRVLPPPPVTLVEIWADWCGPCKELAPMLDQCQANGLPIVRLNYDRDKAFIAQFENAAWRVTKLPTFIMVVDGKAIEYCDEERVTKERVESWIKRELAKRFPAVAAGASVVPTAPTTKTTIPPLPPPPVPTRCGPNCGPNCKTPVWDTTTPKAKPQSEKIEPKPPEPKPGPKVEPKSPQPEQKPETKVVLREPKVDFAKLTTLVPASLVSANISNWKELLAAQDAGKTEGATYGVLITVMSDGQMWSKEDETVFAEQMIKYLRRIATSDAGKKWLTQLRTSQDASWLRKAIRIYYGSAIATELGI